MKKLLIAALLAGVFGVSAYAAPYENKFMSVELANGWNAQEDDEDSVHFFAPNNEAVMSVAKIDAEGMDLKTSVAQLAEGMGVKDPKVNYVDEKTAQFVGPNNAQVTVGMEGKYLFVLSIVDNTGKYTNDINNMVSSMQDK